MKRVAFLSIVVVFACIGPVALYILSAALYSLRYTAYELIVVAVLVDAIFGAGGVFVPVYTLGTIVWLFVVEVLKPRFIIYEQ